jgi:hypothetical protein
LEILCNIEDILVLEAVVLGEEIKAAPLHGNPESLIVPEPGEPGPDLSVAGKPPQEGNRQFVLGGDPSRYLRSLHLLHPPIRIGDPGPEVLVRMVTPESVGIAEGKAGA